MSKLYLVLSIHNHQPVGNFDHVLEDAYKKAYLPFLERLFMHPKIKVVLHYSGNLLLWLEKRHPEAIDMIKNFIRHKRAELLSGGLYEPVLSSLPEDDRVMQIKEMTAYIKDRFEYSPAGMWLAERVWEPHMPKYIAKAGIKYLSVDDYHFKLSGLEEKDLFGYYLTEEEGNIVKVFPGSEKLRYYIPFKDVDTIMDYFRDISSKGSPLLTMADDGEKFGVWPNTHKLCYEEGWLERFFDALEKNDRIETTTFGEYQERFYPSGRVYLPAASYREMGEWTLPPESALDYEYALSEMQRVFGDRAKSLLRGGIWRSFFSKYPESNHIHKRMLMISRKVHEAAKKLKAQSLKLKKKTMSYELRAMNLLFHELWKGQCNDAYWHGIFGGLYLPHLRSSLYRHLLKAESMAEKILSKDQRVEGSKGQSKRAFVEEGDMDCDGFRDISIGNEEITAFLTEESGALIELSTKKKNVNALDILTRRPEAYHSKISGKIHREQEGTRTIHDDFLIKETGLSEHLVYDNYRRRSLLDHFFDDDIEIDNLIISKYEEKGDFIGSPYNLESFSENEFAGVRLSRAGSVSDRDITIEKSLLLKKSEIRVDYLLKGRYTGIFGVEFNLSFLGSPYATVNAGDRTLYIKDKGIHYNINGFSVKDDFLNLRMAFSFDEEVDLWHYPVETISLSEQGVEKLYQGTAFLFMKKMDFDTKKRLRFDIKFFYR